MSRERAAQATGSAAIRLTTAKVGGAGLYIRALAILTLGLALVLAFFQFRLPGIGPSGSFPWASFIFLMVLAALAETCTVRIGSGMELSAGFLTFFLSGAIAGPLAAFIVAVVSQMSQFKRHQWERNLCFAATAGLVAGGTSLLYWACLSWAGGFENAAMWQIVLTGLAAGIFYPLLNFAVVAPVAYLRRGIGVRVLWREGEKPFLPFHAFFLAISLGLIAIYHTYLPNTGGPNSIQATLLVMLCLLPVLGLIYSFRAYSRQHELAKRNARLAGRNERLALQAVVSLIYALDLKDNYTAAHSAAVAQWAGDIAGELGLSEHDVNVTHMASLLHDVGKIGVSEVLLRSPEKLSAENWAEVEGHCQHGYKILRQIDQFDEPAAVVLHHHERYDGNGYPFGLSGERIPLASRIISVADAYSAMISDRPYGPPLPPQIAQAELEFRKGTQFDPAVVECFLRLLGHREHAYVVGDTADFRLEVQAVKFLRNLPAEGEEDLGHEPPEPSAQPGRPRRVRRSDREAAAGAAAAGEGAEVGAGAAAGAGAGADTEAGDEVAAYAEDGAYGEYGADGLAGAAAATALMVRETGGVVATRDAGEAVATRGSDEAAKVRHARSSRREAAQGGGDGDGGAGDRGPSPEDGAA